MVTPNSFLFCFDLCKLQIMIIYVTDEIFNCSAIGAFNVRFEFLLPV